MTGGVVRREIREQTADRELGTIFDGCLLRKPGRRGRRPLHFPYKFLWARHYKSRFHRYLWQYYHNIINHVRRGRPPGRPAAEGGIAHGSSMKYCGAL